MLTRLRTRAIWFKASCHEPFESWIYERIFLCFYFCHRSLKNTLTYHPLFCVTVSQALSVCNRMLNFPAWFMSDCYMLFLCLQNHPAAFKWNHNTDSHAEYWGGSMVRISDKMFTGVLSLSKIILTVLIQWVYIFVVCLLVFRGVLHSNPMDYAWGANGLDAIITQVPSRIIQPAAMSKQPFT